MSAILERSRFAMPGRFAYLMGLYEENYQRLRRVFAPQTLEVGHYVSSVDDGLDVQLDLLEKHAYTIELKLRYRLSQTDGEPASAWLRMYTDAHVAEISHYHAGKHLWHALGSSYPPTRTLFAHRMRMASFLNRWLEYLAEQGHSRGTLIACAVANPSAGGHDEHH